MKVKLDKGAFMPERAHEWDAGADLKTPFDLELGRDIKAAIDTGVHVEIPNGYVGLIKARSSMTEKGIATTGVIDSNYRGSIKVRLENHSWYPYRFKVGDRIAQLVIVPCLIEDFVKVDELDETDRGENGFGSTGR